MKKTICNISIILSSVFAFGLPENAICMQRGHGRHDALGKSEFESVVNTPKVKEVINNMLKTIENPRIKLDDPTLENLLKGGEILKAAVVASEFPEGRKSEVFDVFVDRYSQVLKRQEDIFDTNITQLLKDKTYAIGNVTKIDDNGITFGENPFERKYSFEEILNESKFGITESCFKYFEQTMTGASDYNFIDTPTNEDPEYKTLYLDGIANRIKNKVSNYDDALKSGDTAKYGIFDFLLFNEQWMKQRISEIAEKLFGEKGFSF